MMRKHVVAVLCAGALFGCSDDEPDEMAAPECSCPVLKNEDSILNDVITLDFECFCEATGCPGIEELLELPRAPCSNRVAYGHSDATGSTAYFVQGTQLAGVRIVSDAADQCGHHVIEAGWTFCNPELPKCAEDPGAGGRLMCTDER